MNDGRRGMKSTARTIANRAAALVGTERARRAARLFDPAWKDFVDQATAIGDRHWQQTRTTVDGLKRKYEQAVFGRVRIWDLVERLALCVDPSDGNLGGASQLLHVQQIVAGLERDGVTDPDFYLAAITHDLGKVLLLTTEAPENVVGMNAPIGAYHEGVGLENVVFQWNHDEFIYSRLKDVLPDHVTWLLRFHSILIEATEPFMDARDRDYLERYLRPFRHYDQGTKSCYTIPPRNILDQYRGLVEQAAPGLIIV